LFGRIWRELQGHTSNGRRHSCKSLPFVAFAYDPSRLRHMFSQHTK
jgi:hypothetical protein